MIEDLLDEICQTATRLRELEASSPEVKEALNILYRHKELWEELKNQYYKASPQTITTPYPVPYYPYTFTITTHTETKTIPCVLTTPGDFQ